MAQWLRSFQGLEPPRIEHRLKVVILMETPGLNSQETVSYSNVAPWLWMQSDIMAQWLSRLTIGRPWMFESH